MRTASQTDVRGNGRGQRASVQDMALEAPRAQRLRVPELLIGVAITVGFALAAVLWHANSTQRDPVVALASDVQRAEVISAADLEVVYIGTDDRVAALSPEQGSEVIGRVAVADLDAGTILTRAHVVDAPVLGSGDGVVGLALDPGQYPAGQLSPGDWVNVIGVADVEGGVIAHSAVVYAVEDLGGQGRRFVSLTAAEADANRIASAAEAGPVRLVQVGS